MTKGVVALIVGSLVSVTTAKPFDLPRVESVTIDGDAADWGDRGLRVEFLSNPAGRMFPTADLGATCRLGADDAGLVLLVDVRDDVHDEAADDLAAAANDSVEVYVSAGVGSANRYQFTLTAGTATTQPRCLPEDRRPGRAALPALAREFACVRVDGGYRVEMRLPWANLGLSPKSGDVVGFNVRVNDTDRGPRKSIAWLPRLDSRTNADSVQPLALAAAPTTRPVRALVQGGFDDALAWTNLSISGVPDLAGKTAEIVRGGKVVQTVTLAADPPADPKAAASIEARAATRLPMLARGESADDLSVVVDGTPYAVTIRPDVEETRALRLAYLPLAFAPSRVLESPALPTVDFENPLLAQQAIGAYTVRTTAYDADYNVVTAATRPGRYGLVIDVTPEDGGRPIRRFRTIWRAPAGWDAYAALPRTGDTGVDQFIEEAADHDLTRDGAWPAILAAGGPATRPTRKNDDAIVEDWQWWVGLKRKLNGWDVAFAKPYACPRPIDGPPATTLRAGTPAEAGMSEDGVRAIDAILREWGDKGGEPFGAFVARDGVAVIDAAYGTRRDGRPAAVGDKYWAASITKLLAATAMMTCVEQGLLDLDAPIERYLPAFAGRAGVATPITLRHLYTHTSGVPTRGGDLFDDLDEIIGPLYARLRVGQRYEYTGTGFALGGKCVEAVTGEALPRLYLRRFLQPLGMADTDWRGSAGDANVSARDLATFGQMLLNGGAYGPHRFLEPSTIETMKSQPLTRVLGPDTTDRRGIGMVDYPTSPLGPATFGHGAASNALFRISPDRRLVLVIARTTAGKEYDAFADRLQRAIIDAIVK